MTQISTLVGGQIRRRREELGLRQRELADLMPDAVSNQHISNWERAVHMPSDRNLQALAEALTVDIGYFYSGGDSEPSQLDRIEAKLDALLAAMNLAPEALDSRT